MSSKRKWDQAGPTEDEPPLKKEEKDKSASDAAAAAAAIAARIAAQFADGSLAGASGLKDPNDGAYVRDIDINDVRNRYMLTKGSTQAQVSIGSLLHDFSG
jgi:hypothetical protein